MSEGPMREEMGLDLSAGAVSHLATRQRSYGTEHTFTARADVEADRIELTEGQAVRWFSLEQVEGMRLAYEDEAVLAEFAHAAGAGSTGGR